MTYEGSDAEKAVDRKLASGEIHIGRPVSILAVNYLNPQGELFIEDQT